MNWLDAVIGLSDVVSSNWPQKPQLTWTPGQPSIDIVIPHTRDIIFRGVGLSKPVSSGLMITLMSCEMALRETNLKRKYYIVANCVADSGEEREALNAALEYLDKKGHVGKVFDVPNALSPGSARNLGASACNGDLIFFFDNHCNVDTKYFSSAVQTFESVDADAVHGVILMEGTATYHYGLVLEEGFWGRPQPFPPLSLMPSAFASSVFDKGRAPAYRIASAGHGAYAIKRTTWNEVGGYWDGFTGFGAEETYLDLKLAMMNKSVWLDINMKHEHEERMQPYKIPSNFLDNNLMAAYILGGSTWAERNAASFQIKNRLEGGEDKQYYDAMLKRAIERSKDHAQWFASKRLRTLEEQLQLFKTENVAGLMPSKEAVALAGRITGFTKGLERLQRTQQQDVNELTRKMAAR